MRLPPSLQHFVWEFEDGYLGKAFMTLAAWFDKCARRRKQHADWVPRLKRCADAARVIASELQEIALQQHGNGTAAWVPCECGDWYCRIHDQHTSECACPPIEDWTTDPYQTGGPRPS